MDIFSFTFNDNESELKYLKQLNIYFDEENGINYGNCNDDKCNNLILLKMTICIK